MALKTLPDLVAEARGRVRCIDAVAAKTEIAANQGVLVDVREPGEVAAQKVRGAINIPRGVLEMKIGELCPREDQPIYVHCATGGRAALAAEQLTRLGYRQVAAVSCSFAEINQVF